MNLNLISVLLSGLLVIFLPNTASTQATPEQQPTVLLRQPVQAELVETPSQALTIWRDQQAQKPALLLLSQDPFLQSLPAAGKQELLAKLRTLPAAELRFRLDPTRPNPLLLPPMSVRAAVEAGLFAGVYWVFPTRLDSDQLDLQRLQEQLTEGGFLSGEESEALSLEGGRLNGQLAGTPLQICPLDQLTAPPGPLLLHIDLSYFQPLYRGEIKTPLFELLYSILQRFQNQQLRIGKVSISQSNITGNLPLATRFTGPVLARLFGQPEMLTAPLPDEWDLRRKALYLENFLQTEKIYQLYRELRNIKPADASVHYALYQTLRKLNRGSAALEELRQATKLDSVFALEYLQLVATALEKEHPGKALEMIQLATDCLPQNPFIKLEQAKLLSELDMPTEAGKLLRELAEEPWSQRYYPNMPAYLQQQLTEIADH